LAFCFAERLFLGIASNASSEVLRELGSR
jgi:hypothetical protein